MISLTQQVVIDPPMTLDEYIKSEWKEERRRELVNGRLIRMPELPDFHNTTASNAAYCLEPLRRKPNYQVYMLDAKVHIAGTCDFYYPDVFVTKEAKTEDNHYFKSEPELIVEVLTDVTYLMKTMTKYKSYTSILSLNYYLLIEPKTVYAVLHSKNANGKWETEIYTKSTDVISLPLLEIELPLSEVYT